MKETFEQVWTRLRRELRKGQEMRNWSAAHGFTGRGFFVAEVGN
jgi:hypothetical protein